MRFASRRYQISFNIWAKVDILCGSTKEQDVSSDGCYSPQSASAPASDDSTTAARLLGYRMKGDAPVGPMP